MRKTPGRSMVVATLLVTTAAAVSAGGWTIITVNDFPDYALATQPLTLTFSVRQHGNTLLGGLKPAIRASTASGLEVVATATPTTKSGEYSATLSLATPGDWTLRVDSGFNPDDTTRQYNSVVLPPLRVMRDASAAPPAYSDADRGGRLMAAKGCIGCHRPGSDRDVTQKRFAAAYLETFLADPGIRTADMPNLELKKSEISSLIAFLNGSHGPTAPKGSQLVPRRGQAPSR
jgi:hypothetical protein